MSATTPTATRAVPKRPERYTAAANYQFTRRVGLRLFHERVVERTDDTTDDNFNTVFDYEFTPESHFFFVIVRDSAGTRAIFSKIAYLFALPEE